MYKYLIKRCIDFFGAFFFLFLFSPLFFILILILFISNKGKVFFTQIRPGIHQKEFRIFKFKTMVDRKDQHGNLLPDEERITMIGRFIRSTSLDELPQLINIIKGDMALIGPRPLIPEYLPLYNKSQARRHEVRPGITGWAQVNGRNAISWKKKFELDVWYIDNISFMLDLKIIYLTIIKVFKKDNISKDGFTTTEPFNGNN